MNKYNFQSIKQFEKIQILNKPCYQIKKGSFGKVKTMLHIKTKTVYAIKIVPLIYKIPNAKSFIQQAQIQSQLNHKNIVKLYGYFIQKNNLFLVMEYVNGQNLFFLIKKGLSDDQIKFIFFNLCSAIQYLHQKNVIHRDIKVYFYNQPQNIILTRSMKPKICDFGWSTHNQQRHTFCGTYQYMAPQIVQNMPYNYKIDIWALGILLYQMNYKRAPFPAKQTALGVLKGIKKGIVFYQQNGMCADKKFIDLIIKILKVKPKERFEIKQIIKHEYFSTINLQEFKYKIKHNQYLQKTHYIKKNKKTQNIFLNIFSNKWCCQCNKQRIKQQQKYQFNKDNSKKTLKTQQY